MFRVCTQTNSGSVLSQYISVLHILVYNFPMQNPCCNHRNVESVNRPQASRWVVNFTNAQAIFVSARDLISSYHHKAFTSGKYFLTGCFYRVDQSARALSYVAHKLYGSSLV